MADISKINVNGSDYNLKDSSAARVNDSVVNTTNTWSSSKIQSMYGPVSSVPLYVGTSESVIPAAETRPAILLKIVE